jgi:hypothetical protein
VPGGSTPGCWDDDLYFALTSESGTRTLDEMRAWQSAAGRVPRMPIQLRFAREFGLQVGDRAS